VVLLAAALYVTALADFPHRIDGDAAAQANNAMDFLGPTPPPIVGVGWFGRSNLYYFLQSLPLRTFGPTLVGMRILGAFGGVLAVLFTFLLARSVIGVRGAVVASLALAVMPFHITFARTGLESEHTVWVTALTLWLIVVGWQRRSMLLLLAGGATSGLALYFYQSAFFLPVLVAAQLTLLAGFERTAGSSLDAIRRFIAGAAAALYGFIFVYLPMIVFALQRPDEFFGRIRGTSIIASGWLEAELRTRTLVDILATSLFRSGLPFHYPSRWPLDIFSTPYLTASESAAFSLGLLLLWIGRLGPLWFRLFVAVQFAAGFILLGVLTDSSPVAARYALFMPTVAIMIGLAGDRILAALWTCLPARAASGAIILALLGHGILSIVELTEREHASRRDGTATDIIGTEVGRTLASAGEAEYGIVFLSARFLSYGSHPGLKFITQRTGVDVAENAGCAAIAAALQSGVNYIIAPAARNEELTPFRVAGWDTRTNVIQRARGSPVATLLRIVIPDGDRPERACL
jgi:4-amino-4-deoxy-L-arabinose transferase-like glycosyltransferase